MSRGSYDGTPAFRAGAPTEAALELDSFHLGGIATDSRAGFTEMLF